jgi:glycosyltransferase involved in cell wall biosynthesis
LRNIHFLGYVPNVELPKYLLAADVLIAPYTEGSQSIGGDVIIEHSSPMKLFEYMAVGKPIITSNIGAIPEVMRDGHNGLLVTPGNVDELGRAIIRILSDPLLAKRLGATACKDVIQYTWENRVSRILEFAGVGQADYRRLIE